MTRSLAAACLLLAAPALAQAPAPIHPNDLNATNARERSEQIQRSGNPADYGQMNALDSLRLQSGNMNDAGRITGQGTNLAPIPPERREPAPPATQTGPGPWPGYRPGYLPRQ
jgi:hypothetical protein